MTAQLVVPRWLESARQLTTPSIRRTVDGLPPTARAVATYHRGWTGVDGRPTNTSGGKAIRPALALLAARAVGRPADHGVPAAVAVELVHDFSLVHDDIMDGDTERRGRPTAWRVFGTSQAILAGDALLAAAFEVLAGTDAPGATDATRRLGSTVQQLIAGQYADLEFEQRTDIGLIACLTMIGNKTAALLSCACSLGAVLVGGDPGLIAGLAEFGWCLGMAFQLVDDLLGIWGEPAVTGKPAMADLRSRKKSAPVTAALAQQGTAAKQLREFYVREQPPAEDELPLMADLVTRCGGQDVVRELATEQQRVAGEHLDRLGLAEDVRADLVELAHFIGFRDH